MEFILTFKGQESSARLGAGLVLSWGEFHTDKTYLGLNSRGLNNPLQARIVSVAEGITRVTRLHFLTSLEIGEVRVVVCPPTAEFTKLTLLAVARSFASAVSNSGVELLVAIPADMNLKEDAPQISYLLLGEPLDVPSVVKVVFCESLPLSAVLTTLLLPPHHNHLLCLVVLVFR
jgi:hypothetical protein